MKLLLVFLLLPCLSFAQIRGKKIDVNNFKAEQVKLSLEPNYDLFKLRFDILRQTEEVEVNDTVSETVEVDDHLIGFEIGDFLFADLNDNITLQINKLLNIDFYHPFSLQKSYRPFRKGQTNYYEFNNGVYSYKRSNHGRKHEKFITMKVLMFIKKNVYNIGL